MDQLGNIVRYDSDDELSIEAEEIETLLEERKSTRMSIRDKPLIEEITPSEESLKTVEKKLENYVDSLSRTSERFEEAARRIENAMSSMKTIVDGLVKVSADNLDMERTRLRVLEVNKTSKRVEKNVIIERETQIRVTTTIC